jgi:LmbE family N-acetylglucosaminyl deacetylase
MVCLDAEDGALSESTSAAERLRAVLLETRPQLVYVPFYLEEHADHRAANRVLLDATAGTSLDFTCVGYEVWTPLFPNALVRIDETMPAKKAALSEYRSQLGEADYLHACVGLNAYRSSALLDGRGSYVEAFHISLLSEYRDSYARYCARD